MAFTSSPLYPILRLSIVVVVLLICIFTAVGLWVIYEQGAQEEHWQSYKTANVKFDAHGVPTIIAKDWLKLVEAQGYVVASERMWQMDLMRRSGAGTLSEWFGKKTLQRDIRRVSEDWQGVVRRAAKRLPPHEKQVCQAYARGVNAFIRDFPNSWGVEYSMIRVRPEPWRCEDSLLIVLNMADSLTGVARKEAEHAVWRTHLTDEWQDFLFPNFHPWSAPLIGKAAKNPLRLPPDWQHLPKKELEPFASIVKSEPVTSGSFVQGSNGWVYRHKDSLLLANDPHLRYSVPQVWYALRLRQSKSEWVSGASLPGVPGVVIGMNSKIAWGFTNLGDDVDDYLEEQLNPDQSQYLAFKQGEHEAWRRIIKKKFVIKVRGSSDHEMEAWFSHRGPLAKRPGLGDAYYSRQWLALKPNSLGMPVVKMDRAKNWREFNEALDAMVVPSQAIVFADRKGNIGMRASGVTIERSFIADRPVSAIQGEWVGFNPRDPRKRIFWPPSKKKKKLNHRFIAVANAQIWQSEKGHQWDRDDRRQRIDEVLGSGKNLNLADMESLQLDTHSRYIKMVVDWVGSASNVQSKIANDLRQRWKSWSGSVVGDAQVYTMGTAVEKLMREVLLRRLKTHYFPEGIELPPYRHRRGNGWVIALLARPDGLKAFGLESKQFANYLMDYVTSTFHDPKKTEKFQWQSGRLTHEKLNSMAQQHVFVKLVPLIGRIFKVRNHLQYGGQHLVRAERPFAGPSMRVVFDLKNIEGSRWNFPVGQSGHLRSTHYRHGQLGWIAAKSFPVLDPTLVWE